MLDLLTNLHHTSAKDGGEYAGPCPWCGGDDRFHIWPNHPSGKARFWCRRCECKGDEIDLLRKLKGLTFAEAAFAVGHPMRETRASPAIGRQESRLHRSCPVWQSRAGKVAEAAEATLWQREGARALAYLRGRGFKDETIQAGRLGYIVKDRRETAGAWGLPADHRNIWIPRGIAIPWRACGDMWRLNVRRPAGEPKYCGPAGSGNALYGADGLRRGLPVVLVEGEFDALAVAQEAGGLVSAVATGSTHGARHSQWQRLLKAAPTALVAFDGDKAGEDASAWWLGKLPDARRLAPESDPAAMLEAGADLRTWVSSALADKAAG
jgi:DNA primase